MICMRCVLLIAFCSRNQLRGNEVCQPFCGNLFHGLGGMIFHDLAQSLSGRSLAVYLQALYQLF